jgi:hypothetical protein
MTFKNVKLPQNRPAQAPLSATIVFVIMTCMGEAVPVLAEAPHH